MSELVILAGSALGIFVLAAIAQAVSGFGAAMIAIPLLLLVVDPVTAVVAATCVSTVLSAYGWHRERDHVVVPLVRRLTVAAIVAMPAGLAVLLLVEASTLTRLIGVMLAITVLALALRLHLPAGRRSQVAAGAASGALLTSTGMNGPPLVLLMQATGEPPRRVRASLQAAFALQDVIAVALFATVGKVTGEVLLVSAIGVVGMRLGWALGDKVFHRISAGGFRVVVLVGLAAAAASSLVMAGH
ncbi:sulfite exporter TauE/SafE family protein [Nocardioides sp. AE5]|uniref:sulfite exporter TauE/SafE family protein n=1 Tax=Nocardioides sp. AE5 TaxID=2962573 RepID=UPI002881EB54|nr:sulfite exporter TauE/SafE family protein [Nocardioides sp. AE5]MDT0200830.1 sulfite exporter TauE/SafE family protein [Nocardioides sp. AE5]